MRTERSGRALKRWVIPHVATLAGMILLLPCTSVADELTVDCSGGTPGAYTSIPDAIGALTGGRPSPPWSMQRHTITILSDCVGRIPILDRQGLTIRAPEGETVTVTSPSDSGFVVYVGGSQGIALERLVLRGGGGGIQLFDASEVDIYNCTIEDTSGNGLNVSGHSIAFPIGDGAAGTSAIRNNDGYGIYVYDASEVLSWGTTIEGNGLGGVSLSSGGAAWFDGAMLIRNNGTAGEPGSAGIHLGAGSTLLARGGGTEITDNLGPGVLADANSTVTVENARIENNTGDGVRVLHMSVAQFGPGNALAGNDGASVYCDSTSMAFGDLGDIGGMECGNLEYQVTLCHIPPGNPANTRTITVEDDAVAGHLAHGDALGPCDDGGGSSQAMEIEAGRSEGGLKNFMHDPPDAQREPSGRAPRRTRVYDRSRRRGF